MIPHTVFIDKTLGYALKNKQMDAAQLMRLKQIITEISEAVFDIPLNFFKGNPACKKMGLSDTRFCIEPGVEQVKAAHHLGCTWIKVPIGRQSNGEMRRFPAEALSEANKLKMRVTVGCIDIAERSMPEMDAIQKLMQEYQVHSVIAHDCGSRLDPLATFAALEDLKKKIACKIEYGGKNALGLAAGNALGAIKSGIWAVAASIGGIGGFPAFEEVVMSMRHLYKMPVPVPQNIALYCREALESMDVDIPDTKPVIGSNIFAHESGIHVDGVMKKSELYEPFAPEEVGLSRKIVIGKHSGRAAIEQKIRELNINIEPSCIALLLERVRRLAIEQKAAVVDEQLERLAKEVDLCEGAYC